MYKLLILFVTIFILNNVLLIAQDRVRYTAIPHSDYEFVKWSDDVTTNPRVLTISQYTGMKVPVIYPTTSRIAGSVGFVFNKFSGIIIQEVLDADGNVINTLSAPIEIPRMEALFKIKSVNSNIIDINDTTKQVIVDSVTFDIKYVEGGTYNMGYNKAGQSYNPSHSVTLSNFWMCETEITQALWLELMGTNPSYFNGGSYGTNLERPVESVNFYDLLVFCNELSIKVGLDPVYSINGSTNPFDWGAVPVNNDQIWNNVIMDMSKNGFRLPTEAEWEYAARGGKNNNNYTYSGSNTVGNVAWYNFNSWYEPHTVKTKAANTLGIYDMSGNVAEWCFDNWKNNYNGFPTTPDPVVNDKKKNV